MSPISAPEVPGIVTAAEIQGTVDAIADWQLPSGMIPWTPGGHADPWNHVEAAMALTVGGRIAEAEAGMESCLAMGPTFGRASLTLARVRRQTAASNHVGFIRSRLATVEPGSEDHAAFEFALHKELDDLGRYEEAWHALQRGNGVMQRRLGHDRDSELAAAIAQVGEIVRLRLADVEA